MEAKIKSIEHAHLISTAQLMKENHQLKSIIQRLQCQSINGLSGIGFEFSLPHPINALQFQNSGQSTDRQTGQSSKPGQKKKSQRKLVPIAPHPGNRTTTSGAGRPQPKLMPKPTVIQGIPLQAGSNLSVPLQSSSSAKKQVVIPDNSISMIIAANSSPEWSPSPASSVAANSPPASDVNIIAQSPEIAPLSPASNAGSDTNQSERGSPTSQSAFHTFFSADGSVCYRLEDGRSFCEMLKDQSSREAVDQLFAEPIFDLSGALNDASLDHTLPIASEALTEKNLKAQNEDLRNEEIDNFMVDLESEQIGSDNGGSSDDDTVNTSSDPKIVNHMEIWQRRI